jgi:hypothetical protein
LGAGYFQKAIIDKAHEIGIRVAGVDSDENCYCRNICDTFVKADIRDPYDVLVNLKNIHVSGCITSLDSAQRSLGLLNDVRKLGGITYWQSLITTEKIAMKTIMMNCGIQTPEFCDYGVKKPMSDSGSRGITFSNESEYGYFIEKYYDLQEHTMDGFVDYEGKFCVIGVSDKLKHNNPFVSTEIYFQSDINYNSVANEIQLFLSMFEIKSCPIHVEFLYDEKTHGHKIIEFATRMASGIGTHILSWLSELDYLHAMIALSMKNKVTSRGFLDINKNKCAAFYFFTPKEGIITKINEPKNAHDFHMKKKVGDYVKDPTTDSDRVGHAIYLANSKDELKNKMKEVDSIVETKPN